MTMGATVTVSQVVNSSSAMAIGLAAANADEAAGRSHTDAVYFGGARPYPRRRPRPTATTSPPWARMR
jgi:hypothetical protein